LIKFAAAVIYLLSHIIEAVDDSFFLICCCCDHDVLVAGPSPGPAASNVEGPTEGRREEEKANNDVLVVGPGSKC
jgi:hypothetical protein